MLLMSKQKYKASEKHDHCSTFSRQPEENHSPISAKPIILHWLNSNSTQPDVFPSLEIQTMSKGANSLFMWAKIQ